MAEKKQQQKIGTTFSLKIEIRFSFYENSIELIVREREKKKERWKENHKLSHWWWLVTHCRIDFQVNYFHNNRSIFYFIFSLQDSHHHHHQALWPVKINKIFLFHSFLISGKFLLSKLVNFN